MKLSKSGILAIKGLAIVQDEFDEDALVEKIHHAFESHDGMIAFYAYNYHPQIGQSRIEDSVYVRLGNLLKQEDVDLKQSAAGAKIFALDLTQHLGFSKQSVIEKISAHGVNCLRSIKTDVPVVCGCSILTAPGVFLNSKYNQRNDKCCTLGDFKLFM